MPQFACPHCGRSLRCDASLQGLTVQCPSCRGTFKAGVATDAILDVIPAEAGPIPRGDMGSGPERAGQLFAADLGIDLRQHFGQEVPDEATAEAHRGRWKATMPAVKSAYLPSGALPVSALLLMTVGIFAGITTGVLTESIVGAVAAAVIALLVFLNGALAICGFIYCFAVILLIVGGVISLAAPFLAGGWASAATVTTFGRWGKNRNAPVAVILSVLSAGLSVVAFGFLFEGYFKDWLEACPPFNAMAGNLDMGYLITVGVGGLVALVVAGFVARDLVAEAKFCEACEQFMDVSEIKSLSLGGLQAMTRAMREGNAAIAASLLHAPDGDLAKVALFACPQCSKGYLEVTAHFKATWKDKEDPKKDKELTESWLTASIEIPEGDMGKFRAPAGPIGE